MYENYEVADQMSKMMLERRKKRDVWNDNSIFILCLKSWLDFKIVKL